MQFRDRIRTHLRKQLQGWAKQPSNACRIWNSEWLILIPTGRRDCRLQTAMIGRWIISSDSHSNELDHIIITNERDTHTCYCNNHHHHHHRQQQPNQTTTTTGATTPTGRNHQTIRSSCSNKKQQKEAEPEPEVQRATANNQSTANFNQSSTTTKTTKAHQLVLLFPIYCTFCCFVHI